MGDYLKHQPLGIWHKNPILITEFKCQPGLGDYYIISAESMLKPAINKQKPRKSKKKISNDQEPIQSDPTSCPQDQKGNN